VTFDLNDFVDMPCVTKHISDFGRDPPFDHVVLDDLFEPEVAQSLSREFPAFGCAPKSCAIWCRCVSRSNSRLKLGASTVGSNTPSNAFSTMPSRRPDTQSKKQVGSRARAKKIDKSLG
jgi:hypothetical protein